MDFIPNAQKIRWTCSQVQQKLVKFMKKYNITQKHKYTQKRPRSLLTGCEFTAHLFSQFTCNFTGSGSFIWKQALLGPLTPCFLLQRLLPAWVFHKGSFSLPRSPPWGWRLLSTLGSINCKTCFKSSLWKDTHDEQGIEQLDERHEEELSGAPTVSGVRLPSFLTSVNAPVWSCAGCPVGTPGYTDNLR